MTTLRKSPVFNFISRSLFELAGYEFDCFVLVRISQRLIPTMNYVQLQQFSLNLVPFLLELAMSDFCKSYHSKQSLTDGTSAGLKYGQSQHIVCNILDTSVNIKINCYKRVEISLRLYFVITVVDCVNPRVLIDSAGSLILQRIFKTKVKTLNVLQNNVF